MMRSVFHVFRHPLRYAGLLAALLIIHAPAAGAQDRPPSQLPALEAAQENRTPQRTIQMPSDVPAGIGLEGPVVAPSLIVPQAACTGVDDILQNQQDAFWNLTASQGVGQSFTAPCDGRVNAVQVNVREITSGPIVGTLRVMTGNGTGTTLATTSYSLATTGFQTIVFSTYVPVQSGQVYTFFLDAPTSGAGNLWGINANPYPGGQAFFGPNKDNLVPSTELAFGVKFGPNECDGTEEILQDQGNSFANLKSDQGVGQSFTALCTGRVEAVRVGLFSADVTPIEGTLRVMTGNGPGGATIGTSPYSFTSDSWQRVEFAGSIPVQAGQQYTFFLDAPAAGNANLWAFNGDPYLGGREWVGPDKDNLAPFAADITFAVEFAPAFPTVDVTFQVDMRGPMQNGMLLANHLVGVRGNLMPLDWGSTLELTDPDGDNVFTGTFAIDMPTGRNLEYKFVHHAPPPGTDPGAGWEGEVGPGGFGNRILEGPFFDGQQVVLPLAFFNNLAIPLAVDDRATVADGSFVDIEPLANDIDLDGTIESVTVLRQPASGTLTAIGSTTFRYTPNAGFAGTDTFTYEVADNDGFTSNEATVTITVTASPNQAPVAQDDAVSVQVGQSVDLDAAANDTDADGTVVGVVVVDQPAKGTLSVQGGTTLRYTAGASAAGTDTFTYRAVDDDGAQSNVATVTITITAVPNQAPVAVDDAASVQVGQSVDVNPAANDTDADGSVVAVTVVDQPAKGTLSVQGGTTFRYTAGASAAGTDTFTYRAVDDDGAQSNVATVTITITAVPNQAPVAVDDAVATAHGTSILIDVLANDTDGDGDELTVTRIIEPPLNGTATIESVASSSQQGAAQAAAVRYTPNAGFSGRDGFRYEVSDGRAAATARVTVDVSADTRVTGAIRFAVDMSREIALGNLRSGMIVGVRGSLAPLSWETNTLLTDPDGDGVYEGSVTFVEDAGTTVEYKFVFGPAASIAFEGNVGPGEFGNRVFTYNGTALLPRVFWNGVTGVANEAGAETPEHFALLPNYPNPFNPSTEIAYETSEAGHVRLAVYDGAGRLVRVLVDEVRPAGRHAATFAAEGLPSGVYFCRMEAPGFHAVRALTLLK